MTSTRLASHVAAMTIAVLASSCDKSDKSSSTHTSSANPTTDMAANPTANLQAEPKAQPTPPPAAATPGRPIMTWKNVGLSTPESVMYDDAADVYLVSNIEGDPQEADGKAFISRLGPDGTVATLKWIEGGKNKVTLNSPKGMAFMGDHLYVADIDTVRLFDRKSGAPAGEVKVPGATDLNGVTMMDDRVIVSDTGTKRTGKKTYEPAGTDAVYAIGKDKKVTPIVKSKDLGGPNGLAPAGDKLWVATVRTGEVYALDMKGKKSEVQKLPKGGLDGIILYNDELLVSSWDASAIYRGKPGSEWKVYIQEAPSPAAIGLDKRRTRLLVPVFNENEIRAYELK